MSCSPARIVVADDHSLVRRGLRLLIDEQPDLEVVAEASDGLEAIRSVLSLAVDLAILDVKMPGLTGLQVAKQIVEQRPHVRLLMLSMYDRRGYLLEALRLGASGYVLKSAADHSIVEACRAALRGDPFIDASGVRALLQRYRELAEMGSSEVHAPLTARESEVLKLTAEGHSASVISNHLHISQKTVERHRSNISDKLGMRDRVELTRYAIRHELIDP